ncbi:MAG: hypothetical protein F4X18_10440 [Acidimicrobiia bacterium]|nr:hypothetical protein [Acidimicrobiia bacterium]MYB43772.1 hypothetical protein [Acidimicrobiia bacterium]MYC85916.1 hypothetical protein [Acidimicrobiia bacterium]
MHDIVDLEDLGVPGVFVASDRFAQAADAQGRALGMHPRRVLTAHPIQQRTDEEMRALAEAAFPEILAALTAGQPA